MTDDTKPLALSTVTEIAFWQHVVIASGPRNPEDARHAIAAADEAVLALRARLDPVTLKPDPIDMSPLQRGRAKG